MDPVNGNCTKAVGRICKNKECYVCKEYFDEDERCPRTLPCFHCICTRCIKELIIRDQKRCPYCRGEFTASTCEELPINTVSVDLIKYILYLEAHTRYAKKTGTCTRSDLVMSLRNNYSEIYKQRHESLHHVENQIREEINTNNQRKRCLLENHMALIKDIINKTKDYADKCLLQVEFLENDNRELQRMLDDIQKQRVELSESIQGLDGAHSLTALDPIIERAEASDVATTEWLDNYHMTTAIADEIKEELDQAAKFSEETFNQARRILNNRDEDVEYVLRTLLINKFIEEIPIGQSLVQTLQKREFITKLLLRTDGMYALQVLNGKYRYAKLSFSDDKVFVHCLRAGRPDDVCTFQHRDIMNVCDASPKTVFLEFGTNLVTLGRILISLTPNTRRSLNFSYLCTGALGPSYLHTTIISVWRKGLAGEVIKCGDYEYDDGSGGKAIVEGTGSDFGGVLDQQSSAGIVTGLPDMNGDADASQFAIVTRANPNETITAAFGKIESGLYLLSDIISKYKNISDVSITDCGIVLPV